MFVNGTSIEKPQLTREDNSGMQQHSIDIGKEERKKAERGLDTAIHF